MRHPPKGQQPGCAVGRKSQTRIKTPSALVCVFSSNGGGRPAFHPRLLLKQAGDIESNPGPPCAACKKAIRSNTVPVRCRGCRTGVHASCTGLTRGERRRGVEYTCRACLGGEAALAEVLAEVLEEVPEEVQIPSDQCHAACVWSEPEEGSLLRCMRRMRDQSTQKVHRQEKRPG